MTLNASLASLKAVCSTSKLPATLLTSQALRRFLHHNARPAAALQSYEHARTSVSPAFIPARAETSSSQVAASSKQNVIQRPSASGVRPLDLLNAKPDNPYDLAEIINKLCQEGWQDEALVRLRKVPRPILTDACWNPVVAAYHAAGSYKAGFSAWMDMKRRGVAPSTYGYTMFFNSMSPDTATDRALQNATSVFEQYLAVPLDANTRVGNVAVLNSYINLMASSPRVTEGQLTAAMSQAQAHGLRFDKFTYNTLLLRRIRIYSQMKIETRKQDEEALVQLLAAVYRAHEDKEITVDALLLSTMMAGWKSLVHKRSKLLNPHGILRTVASLTGMPISKTELPQATVALRRATPQIDNPVQLDSISLRGLLLLANLIGQRGHFVAYRWLMYIYEQPRSVDEEPVLDAGHFESAMFSNKYATMRLFTLLLRSPDKRLQPTLKTCISAMSNLPLVDAIRVLALFSGRTDLLVSGEQPLRPRNSEFAIETLRSAYAEETDSTFRMRCCRILLRTARDSRDRRRLQRAMNITESLIDVEQALNKPTIGGGKGGPSFEELITEVCTKLASKETVDPSDQQRYKRYVVLAEAATLAMQAGTARRP